MLAKAFHSRIKVYRLLGACGNMFGLSIILALSLYVAVNAKNTKVKLDLKEHQIEQLEKENNQLRKLNKIGARVCLPTSTTNHNLIKSFYQ
jgi:cell division protein FtsB